MDKVLRKKIINVFDEFLIDYEFDNSEPISNNIYNFIVALGEQITPILLESPTFSKGVNLNTNKRCNFAELVCCKLLSEKDGLRAEGIVNWIYSAPETAESDIAWNILFTNVKTTLVELYNDTYISDANYVYIDENGVRYFADTLGDIFEINDENVSNYIEVLDNEKSDDLSDSNFDEDDEETYITFGDFKEIIKAANKISKEDLGVSLKEITNDEDFEDALMAGCDYMGMSFGDIVKSKGKTVKELAFETFGFEI